MGKIECKVELKPKFKIKARLPRKIKKDIIKVSGREAYKRAQQGCCYANLRILTLFFA